MSSPKPFVQVPQKRKGEYPKKCPFCGKKKWIAKSWARFPNNVLERRIKGNFRLLTYEAEQEWHDFIVCFHCYRIIWSKLDPGGSFEREIDLPTIKELTGWKDLPFSPVVLYDEEGSPIYGTRRSQQMCRQTKSSSFKPCQSREGGEK